MVTPWDVLIDWVGTHPEALLPPSLIVLMFLWLAMFLPHEDM
jgi:hypothetical protein